MAAPDKQNGLRHRSRTAELMALGLDARKVCSTKELRASLEYRLAAPLQFDLGGLGPEMAARLKMAADDEGLLLKSLRDLLEHPRPPLELLVLVKDFAKACAEYSYLPLPQEVGLVLYYTTIAAAWLRWQRRLTNLSDSECVVGMEWALRQTWLDATSRKLLAEASQSLKQPPPP